LQNMLKRIAMKNCNKEKNKKEDVRDFRLLISQVRMIEMNYSEVLIVYQELVKEEPRDFRPYLCHGIIYTLQNHFEKYRNWFRKIMLIIDIAPYRSFHKLGIRYGPLIHVRLGCIPCIIVSSLELAEECLMTNEITFGSRLVTIAIDYLTYNSSGFAFTHFGTVWSFMKKVLMSELLGGQSLKKHGHIRRDEIHNLVLEKTGVNFSEELMKLLNNIITQMMLCMKYSSSKERGEEVRSLVREVTEIFGQFNVSDSFGFLRNLDLQGFLKRSTDIIGRYDILLERILKEREKVRRNKTKGKPRSDVGNNNVKYFLDILLDVSEDMNSEVKLNRDNVKAFLLSVNIIKIVRQGGGHTDNVNEINELEMEIRREEYILRRKRVEREKIQNKILDEEVEGTRYNYLGYIPWGWTGS
ncbi:hypothetical protein MKX03_008794, partial [Papaver bracteatum]